MRYRFAIAAVAACGVLAACGSSGSPAAAPAARPAGAPSPAGSGPAAASSASAGTTAARATALPARTTHPLSYLGTYEQGVPGSYAPVETFSKAVGRQPNVVLYFSAWYEKFQVAFARKAAQHGASVDVDMDPYHVKVADIVSGRYDSYLRAYAQAVRAFKHRVIISFGHEPNGKWYSWGYTRTRPAVWIAAWRHVVTLFRRQGAKNVTWLWIIQQDAKGQGPIRDWWPGRSYVNWVGIDGYFERPGDTFASIFGPTLGQIRKFTGQPVFISETAVGQGAGRAAKIPGLFAGIRARHLLGMLWFDKSQFQGIHHQAWRLEGHPAEVTAFRRALHA